MKFLGYSFQWLLLTFLVVFLATMSKTALSEDFVTLSFKQTLDHFTYRPESYVTFRQRYVINRKYWNAARQAPILALLGNEEPLDKNIGLLVNHAKHFEALLVYIEHRYYGKSIPVGSKTPSFEDARFLGYLNSAQALADYAEILTDVKEKYDAKKSPIIVVGGSYGGMLASWFRLKYPHIALGALASSAPILYFDDITPQNAYALVVSNNFKEVSETCYETIKQSWSKIDEIAGRQFGLIFLQKRFKTCGNITHASQLKRYLIAMYVDAAQYSQALVKKMCDKIDEIDEKDGILSKIYAAVEVRLGEQNCLREPTHSDPYSSKAWEWQKCTEMVMPIGYEDGTMFQRNPFNINDFITRCQQRYNITPRPRWITTYFGGHDIKSILENFGSNIIFSNGMKDPYSSGGVLEDISDTIHAVKADHGTHCQDIFVPKDKDPEWLITMRNTIFQLIQGWLDQYYLRLNRES